VVQVVASALALVVAGQVEAVEQVVQAELAAGVARVRAERALLRENG
jgi:hypothetical protein